MKIKNITFFLTDRCTASCEVCCFQCSPRKTFVQDPEIIRSCMKQAAGLGTVKQFSFTGGEPLMYPDLVLELGGYGFREFGIPFSLVSNGFWGADAEKANLLAQRLKDAGMKEIRLSADIWHQRYVPAASVRNALRAIMETGLRPSMSIMETKDRRVIRETVEALRPEIYFCDDIIYYPTVLPDCVAAREDSPVAAEDILQTFPLSEARCWGLDSLGLFWDGNFYPCCSQLSFEIPRLRLGRFPETPVAEAVDRLNRDPVLEMMGRRDLQWFITRAKEKGMCFRENYSLSCEICRAILNHPEISEEIAAEAKEETQRIRVASFLGLPTEEAKP